MTNEKIYKGGKVEKEGEIKYKVKEERSVQRQGKQKGIQE